MKQRTIYSLTVAILYIFVANSGNFFFGVVERVNWTSTLWEAGFFFIFIFLLLGYRKK